MRKLSMVLGSIFIWGLVAWPILAQSRGGQAAGGQSGSGQSGRSSSGQGQSGGTVQMGSPAQSMSSQTGQNQPVVSGGVNRSGGAGAGGSALYQGSAQGSLGQSQQNAIGSPNQSNLQGQGSQSTLRDQIRSETANSAPSGQNQSDALQRFRDQQRLGNNQNNGTTLGDSDNARSRELGSQSFSDRNNNRKFRFDDRPEFRDGLLRRGLPADDWRVVFHNGGYWFWTPNRTWLTYNNGDWVPFDSRVRVGRPTIFPRNYPSDDWRMVNNGGRWWFWTPNETWLYYDNGNWVDYQPGVVTQSSVASVGFPPGYPQDNWRLVFHNDRWWFYSPERTWMVYDGGSWTNFGNRQTVGFRGVEGENQRQFSGPDSSARLNQDTAPTEAQRDQMIRQQSQTFDASRGPVGGTATSGTGMATSTPPGVGPSISPPSQTPTPNNSSQSATSGQASNQTNGSTQAGSTSTQGSATTSQPSVVGAGVGGTASRSSSSGASSSGTGAATGTGGTATSGAASGGAASGGAGSGGAGGR